MTFKAGDPRPAKAGRKKGTPNKVNVLIKDAVVEGASTTRYGDLTDYFRMQAVEQPAAFLALIGRIIPLQIEGDVKHAFTITSVTHRIIDDRRETIDAIENAQAETHNGRGRA